MDIPFGDLKRQYAADRAEFDAAVARVLASGWYILGSEVHAFETAFATYCGVAQAVGVANGTDALYLALVANGVASGDEVITVANAGIYQLTAIAQTGACPVFIDVDPLSWTMDPMLLEAAITPRTRAIMPVHLYGRMADMAAINAIAEQYELVVIEDAAQAHGAWREDSEGEQRRAGAWGACGCFSFYPSKNLGAFGDGGAIVTNDAALAEHLRQLRQYGWGKKYITEGASAGGRNSRLDELQAALLRVKLAKLDGYNAARRERAAWYTELLSGSSSLSPASSALVLPTDDGGHVYHLYVVAHPQRDALREILTNATIGNDIHYPLPAHRQTAYEHTGMRPTGAGSLPYTEQQAAQVLSLPIFPEMTRAEVEHVAKVVLQGIARIG
jgi:dTDP-4-amino-4,6-dideoxygalactose transaminase